jgi:hypothetical protein
MNWANWNWAASLDQLWRSSTFSLWVMFAAAGFFGLVVLITLLRAERTVANGALIIITLLAVGIGVVAIVREPAGRLGAPGELRSQAPITSLPALSCIDDLAGDAVLSACEKTLFGSAESVAAAVSYAAAQLSRLTALGDATTVGKAGSPELLALRRAVERDRYGLVAQVLLVRDHCLPTQCAAFRSMTDTYQISSNMEEHVYDALVSRYAPMWNAPVGVASPLAGPIAALGASVPTGKPTNAEFPTSASTPAVSIMTPEPATGTAGAAASARPSGSPAAATTAPAPRPATSAAPPAVVAAKKQPASKPARTPPPPPVQIAPPASTPAASND